MRLTIVGKQKNMLIGKQFNIEHQWILLKKLQEIGLMATLNKDKMYYRIRFRASCIEDLKSMIYNNIIPSMRYKLGYNPVETCPYGAGRVLQNRGN